MLHQLKALSLEQWSWVAVIAAAVIAAIGLFSKPSKRPSKTKDIMGGGTGSAAGDGNTVHNTTYHIGESPQVLLEIRDQLREIRKHQQESSATRAENQEPKRQVEELTRQAVTAAPQGAGQPANQKQLLAQLGAADVSEAVNILLGKEQHVITHARTQAAQLAREQGELLLGSDAEGAYRAFERAHEYEPRDLSTLWRLVDLAQILGSLNDAKRWVTAACQMQVPHERNP